MGQRLAAALGRPFTDFDTLIEAREGASVAALFARHEEPHFRSLELQLTRQMADLPAKVLAPGGGWCTVPGAVELLCPPGVMVYLRVRPEIAFARLASGGEHRSRPLLSGPDPLADLRDLLAARESAYHRAQLAVDAEDLVDSVVTTIIRALAAPGRLG